MMYTCRESLSMKKTLNFQKKKDMDVMIALGQLRHSPYDFLQHITVLM